MRRWLLAAPLLVSCATTIPQTGGVTLPPSTSLASWETEMAEATRRVEPYDWFMRQADLRATLITPRLRKAFLDERARFHGRFADETQRELIGLGNVDEGVDAARTIARPEGEEQVLVFVAMYAADQKNRDLSASYSIWDTALVRGDKKVKPISVENVRASPAVREVFPYIDRFDDLYLFRFPLVEASSGTALFGPGPEELRLEVKSALAECVVSWTLQGT
ncbi:MAG: hypothetical protein Q8O67_05900 [Deltaproteobacteria bacterium]|nr:hypothetical protein [Deltaproteobacteria bacterium]